MLNVIRRNKAAADVLRANGLIDEKSGVRVSEREINGESEVIDELNITLDSLLKVLTRYDIPPAACSHIRGQEQIFGSRISRDDKNNVTAYGKYSSSRMARLTAD